MATGDRVKIITSTQFDPLHQQINDPYDGISSKVNLLGANMDVSNVNPYDPSRAYVAGNLALVNGRLQRANKFTTGTLTVNDWEDPSPVVAVTSNRAMVSDDEGKPIASVVTDDELAKIRGGAAIQDGDISDDGAFLHNDAGTMKQTGLPALWRWIVSKVTGGSSTILTDNLTPDRSLVSNAEGKVTPSLVTSEEVGYLSGANSNIQEQLNAKAVSSGYFQQDSVTSDDWTSICEVGGLSIEARNPGFTSSFPIRIVNQTGETLVHVTDKLYDNGTRADGVFVSGNGASLGISPPVLTADSQDRLLGSSYVSGNGFGLSEKAWSYNVVVRRIGTTGYRIIASLVGN